MIDVLPRAHPELREFYTITCNNTYLCWQQPAYSTTRKTSTMNEQPFIVLLDQVGIGDIDQIGRKDRRDR